MDLAALKSKYRHKTAVDLKDFDTALSAVPFLVREVERLEIEVAEREKRITHLQTQLKGRTPVRPGGEKRRLPVGGARGRGNRPAHHPVGRRL